MKHLEYIQKNIKEAFARAMREDVTGKVKPKVFDASLNAQTKQIVEQLYDEKDANAFKQRADALIVAAVRLPRVGLQRHRANSYYVGDIDQQPRAEDLFAEVVKHLELGG